MVKLFIFPLWVLLITGFVMPLTLQAEEPADQVTLDSSIVGHYTEVDRTVTAVAVEEVHRPGPIGNGPNRAPGSSLYYGSISLDDGSVWRWESSYDLTKNPYWKIGVGQPVRIQWLIMRRVEDISGGFVFVSPDKDETRLIDTVMYPGQLPLTIVAAEVLTHEPDGELNTIEAASGAKEAWRTRALVNLSDGSDWMVSKRMLWDGKDWQTSFPSTMIGKKAIVVSVNKVSASKRIANFVDKSRPVLVIVDGNQQTPFSVERAPTRR